MLRLGTDGSGVKSVIFGCPFCEDGKYIIYELSSWYATTGREIDTIHDIGPIEYCPYCGEKLPSLDGWMVIDNIKGVTKDEIKSTEGLKKACLDLIYMYRDMYYGSDGGFVGRHRVKEWVKLCDVMGEPTESK